MRFYILSMNFVSMFLNIVLSHAFFSVSLKQILHKEFQVYLTQSSFLLHKSKNISFVRQIFQCIRFLLFLNPIATIPQTIYDSNVR